MAHGETVAPAGVADDIRGGAAAREERAAAARAALESAALPAGDLNAALPHLRRPFAPEAVKFKVQTVFPKGSNPTGCVIVTYIDVRLVIERLNAVCGGEWESTPRPAQDGKLMWCDLAVFGRTRPDIGQSPKGLSKDLWSDALKRAAVQFGVGVSVYALPQITLYLNDAKGRIEKRGQGDRTTIVLTDHGHERLRASYRQWLDLKGEAAFGPVLDHGDIVPETIDPDAEAALAGEDFAPALPPALTDDKAAELTERAKALYAEIAAVDGARKTFPPAQFDAWLRQSAHSHDELQRLVDHVQSRRDELVGGEAS